MKKIILVICLFVFSGCSRKITVLGTCSNAKSGAVIVTDTNSVYFIDGIDRWSKDYMNKRVQVIGRLRILENKTASIYDQTWKRKLLLMKPRIIMINSVDTNSK